MTALTPALHRAALQPPALLKTSTTTHHIKQNENLKWRLYVFSPFHLAALPDTVLIWYVTPCPLKLSGRVPLGPEVDPKVSGFLPTRVLLWRLLKHYKTRVLTH